MSQGHGTDDVAAGLGVPERTGQRFAELVAVMDRLRSPGDRKSVV